MLRRYGDLESELGFSITSTPRRGNTPRKGKKVKKTYATLEGNQKYTVGPYCKRTKGTPGRNVTKALGNRKLNEAKEMMDENGRTGFGHPKDLDLDAELYVRRGRRERKRRSLSAVGTERHGERRERKRRSLAAVGTERHGERRARKRRSLAVAATTHEHVAPLN